MPQQAWQPFTPRGVAAFAGATLTRLVLVQLAIAALLVIALVWFLRIAWVPVITDAIQHLPDAGFIRRGELTFGAESPVRLAGNTRLGVVVDIAGMRGAGQIADLEVTFEKDRLVFHGPLGEWSQPYDRNYIISLNRPELEPAWGAWRGPLLAMVAIATVLSVLMMWWGVGLLYLPLVKLIAFFADRGVTWRGAWRLSAAAPLPGACLVAMGLMLYAFGAIDLLRFGLLHLLHVLTGLVFAITSPSFLPKIRATNGKNPFAGSDEAQRKSGAPPNPFGRSDEK